MKKLWGISFLLIPYYNFGGENIDKLKLYRISEKYAKYISYQDKKVLKAFETKNKRPFIGIILEINEITYFAPLSSPKKKHENMKNSIDFIKINNGRDGVINLNNMIPIPKEQYVEINIKEEIQKDKKYGIILKYQIKWCNENKNQIVNNAKKLYNLIINRKANLSLKNRCCNFKVLEIKLNQFIKEKSE